MKHSLAATALTLLATSTAAADDVRSKPLTLHPPAPAARALQYALLPELQDMTPGNAADHYRQAIKNMKQDAPPEREWQPSFDQWMAGPLKDFPREEVARFLLKCDSIFKEVDAGARCEQCDWGLTEEVRRKGFASGLDVLALNAIGKLVALRCRCELAQERTQDAMRTLRTGFTLGRHLADAPEFADAIFGMGVAGSMLHVMEEVVQQPDAPSLYWPLTDLPRPLFDLRKPMQGERLSTYGFFPGAADPDAKPWTPEQVRNALDIVQGMSANTNPLLSVRDRAEMLLRIAARHEAAKKALRDEGRPKELVDAMPHVQVALLVALRQWDRVFDELLKCQSLPYAERLAAWSRADARRQEILDDRQGPAIPLWQVHARDGRRWLAWAAQLDRQVAALRCVEALRLYAAGHGGKFPAALDDIKDVPIPDDPVTGKPFGYRLVGDRAFLTSTPFPGQPANNASTPTYELIFSR